MPPAVVGVPDSGDIALRSVTVKPSGAVPIARLTLLEKWPGDESIRLARDNHEGRLNDAPQVFSEWHEGRERGGADIHSRSGMPFCRPEHRTAKVTHRDIITAQNTADAMMSVQLTMAFAATTTEEEAPPS
jgi:hypothetical protein